MFEFLFGKGRRKESAAVQTAAVPASSGAEAAPKRDAAPGTAIHYSPDLIDILKRDHQTLLTQFSSITTAFNGGDYVAVAQGLDAFRTAIQAHLLTENVRLYIYLEHQLAHDADSHELIHGFRHEMDGIGKALVGFLAKYKDIRTDQNLIASFGRDVEAVGKVLIDRIQREETTLYPLYMASY